MPEFDYGILARGQATKLPQSDIYGNFTKGLNDIRANQFKQTVQGELSRENPDMNLMLAGLAGIDPLAAYKQASENQNLNNAAQFKLNALGLKNSQDVTTTDNVKQIAVQYRNYLTNRYSDTYNDMSPEEQNALNQSIAGIRQLLRQSELGRALLGEVDTEVGVMKQEVPTADTEDKTEAASIAFNEIKSIIDSGKIDKNNDGIIDGIVELSAKVNQYKDTFGNTNDVKNIMQYLKDTIQNVKDTYLAGVEKADRSRTIDKQYKEDLPALKAIENIDNGDNSLGTKTLAAGLILKFLSGAGVTDSERINTMLALTSPKFAEDFRKKGSGLGKALFKKYIVDNEQEILNEITRNADSKLIRDQLDAFVTRASKQWYKNTQAGNIIKPKQTTSFDFSEF
jgi:hypothetical protein